MVFPFSIFSGVLSEHNPSVRAARGVFYFLAPVLSGSGSKGMISAKVNASAPLYGGQDNEEGKFVNLIQG
jgi:hypothetical protein